MSEPIHPQMAIALRAAIDNAEANATTEDLRRQARYFQLLASGLSDYEARGEAYGDEP